MDWGQTGYVLSRLILGALASFLAIMLWSRTRDAAWMLVIIGTIVAYLQTIYAAMSLLGIVNESDFTIGIIPLSILLSSVPQIFIIAAFLVILTRKYRHR